MDRRPRDATAAPVRGAGAPFRSGGGAAAPRRGRSLPLLLALACAVVGTGLLLLRDGGGSPSGGEARGEEGSEPAPLPEAVSVRASEGASVLRAAMDGDPVVSEGASAGLVGDDAHPRRDDRLALESAGVLSGTVTDLEGLVVVGARVRASAAIGGVVHEVEAATDGSGGYRIEPWPVRPSAGDRARIATCVRVEAEGYASRFVEGVPLAVPGEGTRQDLVLARGASVAGRVLDADTDAPIPGARVVLWVEEGSPLATPAAGVSTPSSPWPPRMLARGTSGPDGTLRFEHVPADGAASSSPSGVRPGGPVVAWIGAWAEGRVAASAPVPRAADGAGSEVVLRLVRGVAVRGRVVDGAGRPVAGAVVVPRIPPPATYPPLPRALFPDAPVPTCDPTTGDGRYVLSAVPVGRVPADLEIGALWREQPGLSEPSSVGRVIVRTRTGAPIEAPDLELRPLTDGVTVVRIDVLDARGAPVPGAWAFSPASPLAILHADGEGHVRWPVRSPSREGPSASPDVIVRAAGHAPSSVRLPVVLPQPAAVEVRLAPGHGLSGTVLRADGVPVADATVRATEGEPDAPGAGSPGARAVLLGSIHEASTDATGRFHLEDLGEGPYTLEVFPARGAGGDALGTAPLGSRAGVPVDVQGLVLRLPEAESRGVGSLEGAVVDRRTGRPVPACVVRVFGANGSISPSGVEARPVGEGGYVAEALPPGRYTLVASAPGRSPVRVSDVEVRAGERAEVPSISLEAGILVRGRVTFEGGQPPPTGRLAFVEVDGSTPPVPVEFDAAGRYETTGLWAGRWILLAHAGGGLREGSACWVAEDGAVLTLREGDLGPRTRDAAFVAAGRLILELDDPRLPPPARVAEVVTPRRREFGERARLRVVAPDGSMLVDRCGLHQGVGPWSCQVVRPGAYVVRLGDPDGGAYEQTLHVEAGRDARFRGRVP